MASWLDSSGDIGVAQLMEALCQKITEVESAHKDLAVKLASAEARALKAESKVKAQGNIKAQGNRFWRKYQQLRLHQQHQWLSTYHAPTYPQFPP
jgi:hypothetical protein